MKKVSVIIPVYNVGLHLEKCLNSCLNQSLDGIEIIVVNDGSNDNSKNIIDDFIKRYSNIINLNQSNSGVVSARKHGLSIAKGEFIFYLDGDDFLPMDILEKMYALGKLKNYDIVFGDIISVDESHTYIETIQYGLKTSLTGQDLLLWILENKVGYLWGKLIRKSLYKNHEIIKFSDLKYCEDLIEIIQLSNFSKSVIKIDSPTYNYVQRAGSVCKSNVEFSVWANRYKKILDALNLLINNSNFTGVGSLKLKRLYLFYSVLFLWFNKGFMEYKRILKPQMLKIFKTRILSKITALTVVQYINKSIFGRNINNIKISII